MNENPLKVLRDKFPELAQWIKSICRCGKIEDFITADYKEDMLFLKIYTKNYSYHIVARLPDVKKMGDGEMLSVDGYLSCTGQARKPIAGENWTRGNDLPDGSYSEKTWRAIMEGIIGYELVKVAKPKKLEEVDKI